MADSLALSPVAVGVYTLLNVASLTSLATGGIYETVPPRVTFPFVLFEAEERDVRGFGTSGLPEVSLRVHVYDVSESLGAGRAVLAKAIELLKDKALTVSGYTMCGHIFYDQTVTLPNEMINGIACHEWVAQFRAYVEEV